MTLVTVVMDLDEELVPGLTKAQLRAIVKRTAEYQSIGDPLDSVDQVSDDLAADVERGIAERDRRKAAYKQARAQDAATPPN